MKLNATQAHTLNLLRSAHDSIVDTADRLKDRAAETADNLAKGHGDTFNDLPGITGLATELARLTSMRATARAVAATFLDEATVHRVMTGRFAFYWDGADVRTDAELAAVLISRPER